jgi:hypothetical protein
MKKSTTPVKKTEKILYKNINVQPLPSVSLPPQQSVTDVIEERKKIENQALAQDIQLKKQTLFILFIFLAAETIAIFLYSFFQGVHAWNFALEEWSFKLLIAATIIQITLMVQIAVKHLFPQGKEKAGAAE